MQPFPPAGQPNAAAHSIASSSELKTWPSPSPTPPPPPPIALPLPLPNHHLFTISLILPPILHLLVVLFFGFAFALWIPRYNPSPLSALASLRTCRHLPPPERCAGCSDDIIDPASSPSASHPIGRPTERKPLPTAAFLHTHLLRTHLLRTAPRRHVRQPRVGK